MAGEGQETLSTLKWRHIGPPKSLQGMENIDQVWQMITRRFPNAAPLLCEMEFVIDQAQDLLRRLREPLNRMESPRTPEENPVNESLSCQSHDSIEQQQERIRHNHGGRRKNSYENIMGPIDFQQDSISSDDSTSCESSNDDSKEDDRDFLEIDMDIPVCDQTSTTDIEQPAKEISKINEFRAAQRDTMADIEKVKLLQLESSKQELQKNFNATADLVGRRKKLEVKKLEPANHLNSQKIGLIKSKIPMRNRSEKSDFIANDEVSGRGSDKSDAENKSEEIEEIFSKSKKTPLSILENYVNRCNVQLEFNSSSTRSNRYKNICRLSGYKVTSLGNTEEIARNNAALEMLRLLAISQMENRTRLMPDKFSKQEMLEILEFGLKDFEEHARWKLYKLCLEKNEPVPSYEVKGSKTSELMFTAKCFALGIVGEGSGRRDCTALKMAAENAYKKYEESCSRKNKQKK